MNTNTRAQRSDTSDPLKMWFIKKLALVNQIDESTIKIDRPLVEYGLDSINSLAIAGELEELINIELPATLLWDYPTINKVTDFIKSKTI